MNLDVCYECISTYVFFLYLVLKESLMVQIFHRHKQHEQLFSNSIQLTQQIAGRNTMKIQVLTFAIHKHVVA